MYVFFEREYNRKPHKLSARTAGLPAKISHSPDDSIIRSGALSVPVKVRKSLNLFHKSINLFDFRITLDSSAVPEPEPGTTAS